MPLTGVLSEDASDDEKKEREAERWGVTEVHLKSVTFAQSYF